LKGLIGPFQTIHSASTALAGALLVIFYYWLTSAYNKSWLIFIFIIGLYFLFNTYARTGLAMLVVGGIVMLGSFGFKNRTMLLRVMIVLVVSVPLLFSWVLNNDALLARLQGQRTHSSETDSLENLGSGRVLLANSSLEIYSETSFIEGMFGMGVAEQKKRMQEKIGYTVIPHNGFIGVLLHFGLIGLLFFIWFLIGFWRSIRRLSDSNDVALLNSLFAAYIVMTFFQQQDMLYHFLLLMLAYSWKINSEAELIR
jgi:O-antigen ligase